MPVLVRVSQATLAEGSCCKWASRMASETWSAILSGWPSPTDSEVKRKALMGGEEMYFWVQTKSRTLTQGRDIIRDSLT